MKSSSSSSSVSRAAATKVHPNPFQNSISAARKQGAARTHFSLSTARDETSGAQKKNFGGLSVKAPPPPSFGVIFPPSGLSLACGSRGGKGGGGNVESELDPPLHRAIEGRKAHGGGKFPLAQKFSPLAQYISAAPHEVRGKGDRPAAAHPSQERADKIVPAQPAERERRWEGGKGPFVECKSEKGVPYHMSALLKVPSPMPVFGFWEKA